jgi:hypothetical protein
MSVDSYEQLVLRRAGAYYLRMIQTICVPIYFKFILHKIDLSRKVANEIDRFVMSLGWYVTILASCSFELWLAWLTWKHHDWFGFRFAKVSIYIYINLANEVVIHAHFGEYFYDSNFGVHKLAYGWIGYSFVQIMVHEMCDLDKH